MIDLESLVDAVSQAGYIAVVDNGDVNFKVEGTSYRLETFATDETYARLRVAFVIPPDISIETLLSIANEQNRKTKAVKTVVYPLPEDRTVGFSVELFFSDPAVWADVFERALTALRITSDEYYASFAKVAKDV